MRLYQRIGSGIGHISSILQNLYNILQLVTTIPTQLNQPNPYLSPKQKLTDLSPAQRTWKVFKRNKIAVAGLLFIILITLVAILGYLIMPDSTPDANNMTIQLSIKKPGSQFMMLRLRKTEPVDTFNIFHKMFFGQPSFYTDIPITGYRATKDSIYVQTYVSAEDKPEPMAYYTPKGGKYGDAAPPLGGWGIIHKTFLLGTDVYGRDLLSRLILGSRVSLSVGLMSVIISMLLGVTIGAMAGYFGGWIDDLVVWFYTTLSSIPNIMLLVAITFVLGKGLTAIYFALGATAWVGLARVIRGEFIKHKSRDYVVAANSLGATHMSRIFKHILPNVSHFVIINTSIQFVSAIKSEVILSFLGLGVQGQPS